MPREQRRWRGHERRRFIRTPTELTVSCRPGGKGGEGNKGRTENISVGGIELVASGKLPLGEEVEVSIGSESDGVQIALPGTISRCIPLDTGGYRVAITFGGPLEERRDGVLKFVPPRVADMRGRQNRSFVRVRCELPVWFKRGWFSRQQSGRTVDLSVAGLMLRTDTRVRPDERLYVRLGLPGRQSPEEALTITSRAVSVREEAEDSYLVSAAFVDVRPENEGEIVRYVVDQATCGPREGQ